MRVIRRTAATAVCLIVSAAGGLYAQRAEALPPEAQGFAAHLFYDANTGELVVQESQTKTGVELDGCYKNSVISGLVKSPAGGLETLVDWGVMGGTGPISKCEGASDIVGSLGFGYATSAASASMRISLYQGTPGFCDSAMTEVFSMDLTALPGHTGPAMPGANTQYEMTIDLIGGSEFVLPDGPIGFGFTATDVDPFDGSMSGSGWVSSPIIPEDGHVGAYDVWSPAPGPGNSCATVTGGPGSFFQFVERAVLPVAASAVVDNPGSVGGVPNPDSFMSSGLDPDGASNDGGPVLGGTVTFFVDLSSTGHTLGTVIGFFGATTMTVANGQILLVDLAHPDFEILGLFSPLIPAPVLYDALPVPIDLTLCGLVIYVQGVQLGGMPTGWPGFVLTNRITFTVGG